MYAASLHHEYASSQMRLIQSCLDKILLIKSQSEFLVPEDAVDLVPSVAWWFWFVELLFGRDCGCMKLERVFVSFVYLVTLLVYPALVYSVLVIWFMPSHCSDIIMIALHVILSISIKVGNLGTTES